jgi:hypothetical protein
MTTSLNPGARVNRLPKAAWLLIVLAAGALLGGRTEADEAGAAEDTAALPRTVVRDLHYGDVLFHYFQEDYFDSLVRLEASRDFGRMPNHEAEAELLSGGLYLSLGLHNEATRIFKRLLTENVPGAVRDRAWFYLARIGYQRGYYAQAAENLQQIRAPLGGGLEPERKLLEANVLMAQERFAQAAQVLQAWQSESVFANYARFNLGVALLRSEQAGQGRQLLDGVGRTRASDEEQRALKDRANLALGFELLQAGQGEQAAAVLGRVRLDGPFTSRALLGLGWAESEGERFERALVPWLELREQRLLDSAVQESFLAVPYAYARLAANGQAAERYQEAVRAYASESQRIDESIAAIRAGGFLAEVLEEAPAGREADWFWQLEKLPDAPRTRYLYHLLATHEFQEGLKNYRDLTVMQQNLERWRGSLGAFDNMVETRQLAAQQRAPRKQRTLANTNLPAFEQRQQDLEQRVGTIRAARDVTALANPGEAGQLQLLDAVGARLSALPPGPQRDALAERARVLRGTLLWRLDADYKVRLRHAERGLRDSASALNEARERLATVPGAAEAADKGTVDFAQRRADLERRIDELEPRMQAAAAAQERVLASLAVQELESQKRRLASYATQAQFALAAIYDGAALGAAR